MQWYTRGGEPRGGIGAVGFLSAPRLSSDGRRVAVVRDNVLEAIDLRRGITSRLAEKTANRSLVWSPAGDRIAFNGAEGNIIQVKQRTVDGSGSETLIATSKRDQYVSDWTSDGRSILYIERSGDAPAALRLVPVGGGTPRDVMNSGHPCLDATISPDGRWIAYVTNESGRLEVYVQGWDADLLRPRDARAQVSANGGNYPRWRRDGKELFYQSRDGILMAVALKTSGGRRDGMDFGSPAPLFSLPVTFTSAYSYDVGSDSDSFLVIGQFRRQVREPLTVVVNWAAIVDAQ
jgi:Tol biopolymer transport system component